MELKKYDHISDLIIANETNKNIKKYIKNFCDDVNIAFLEVCKSNNLELAKWILKTFIDLNPYFEEGIVLSWACLQGDKDMFKWLYNLKHDKSDVNFDYCFYAICEGEGNVQLLEYLLDKENIDIKKNNYSVFLTACQNGNIDIVKYLIKQYSTNDYLEHTENILSLACFHGYLDIFKLFAELSPNFIKNNSKKLYKDACDCRQEQIAKYITHILSKN